MARRSFPRIPVGASTRRLAWREGRVVLVAPCDRATQNLLLRPMTGPAPPR